MENPLLHQGSLPTFSNIIPHEHVESAIRIVLDENRAKLAELLKNDSGFSWENLMMPLEEMADRLSKVWSPVSHLHAVCESEELRAVYNACLPILTEYSTEIMQNENLFQAVATKSNKCSHWIDKATLR